MHLRSEEVLPPLRTRSVDLNREPISNKDFIVLIGPASLLSSLKAIHQLGETPRQMGFVQQFATHSNPSLNTRATHLDNREREEIPTRLEEVDLEDISVHFLSTYSTHPDWKQIISIHNDYGQTLAHISVAFGYFRLLQRLFGWQIDLTLVDSMGLTALHYAYLFKQEECAKFLIHSGVDQFVLDDLGRSPSDLDPSLEVELRSIMEIDSGSADGASPNQYDTEMPDEARKLYAKDFLIQQWMQQGEDERKGEVSQSRCQSQENRGATNVRSSSSGVCTPEERPTPAVAGEIDLGELIEMANIIYPRPPISEVSPQTQEANRLSDTGQNLFSHPAPLSGGINALDVEHAQIYTRRRAFQPRHEPSLVSIPRQGYPLLSGTSGDIKEQNDVDDDIRRSSDTVQNLELFVPHQSQLDRDPYSVPVAQVVTVNPSDTVGPSSPSHAPPRGDNFSNRRKASLNAEIPPAKRSHRVLQPNATGNSGTQVCSTDESLGFESLAKQPEVQKAMRDLVAAIRTSQFFINKELEPNLGALEAIGLMAVASDGLWRGYGTEAKSIYTLFIEVDGKECKCLWCGDVQKGKLQRAVDHFRAKHMEHEPFLCGNAHYGNEVW